jgi:hypothetical protein
MNTYYLSISSGSMTTLSTFSELSFQDDTTLSISISGINETLPPLYVKASWGDGDEVLLINDPIKKYSEDNIYPEIILEKYSKILCQRISKDYKAPSNTLYSTLTAKLSVVYPSDDISTFTIPIKIRKNDYFENFDDIILNNSRFVDNLKREYQFFAKNSNKLFENVTTD